LLASLGFEEVRVREPFVGFREAKSDTLLVLPPYRGNALVAPHHLAQVRVHLDAKGLLDAQEFDRLLGGAPTPRSASR
jgi:hypothetical protein